MLPTLLLCLPAPAPLPAGDLLLVSQDAPAGGFDSIAAAAAAAPPGSTILIRGGSYAEDLELGDKSLDLVATDGAELRGTLRVADLPFFDDVLVDGLRLTGATRGIELRGCAGTVWLEDVEVDLKSVPSAPGLALDVDLCDSVLISGGRFSGRPGPQGDGVAAGRLVDSAVWVYAADFASVPPDAKSGAQPGNGLEVFGSLVFLSTSTIAGADGTASTVGPEGDCVPGAGGGAGLVVADGEFIPSEVAAVQTTLAPGGAGAGTDACPGAPAGKPLVVSPASTLDQGALALGPRTLEATQVAVAGEPLELEFGGAPGEFVLGVIGLVPAPVYEPALGGVVATFDTTFVSLLGTLDDDGRLERVLPIQPVLGVPATRIFSQGLMFSPADLYTPTPPRSTAVLAGMP